MYLGIFALYHVGQTTPCTSIITRRPCCRWRPPIDLKWRPPTFRWDARSALRLLENPKAKGPRSPCECVLSSGSPDIFANRRDVGRTEIRAHLIQVTECKKRGSRCATLSRVRAMTTAAATAVTSTQVITGGEDDRRSFQVITFSYHEQGSRGGVTHGRGSRRRFVELIRMLYRHLMIEAGGTKAIPPDRRRAW
jgi:hypothetical protein